MEKHRRLFDILPPFPLGKTSSVSKEKKPGRKPKRKGGNFPVLAVSVCLIFGVAALAGGALLLQLFFAQATVSLWPQTRQVQLQENIVARTTLQKVSPKEKAIPAKVFVEEKSLMRLFPASGSRVAETKASGVLTVFNKREVPQILVANTRFISEEGKLFRSQTRVVIPAASGDSPGSLQVQVLAAEGGEEYNIGPSNFSLPGLAGSPLYTLVYGKSEAPMAGGSKTQQVVVTKSDIENAKEKLVAAVTELAKNALGAKIPQTFTVQDESITTRVLEASTSIKEGAVLEHFTYEVKVLAQALVFEQSALEELSRGILLQTLQDNERIHEKTFRSIYTVNQIDMKNGVISLQGDISSAVYVEPSLEALRASLLGKTKGEVAALLLQDPGVARFSFSFWPFWVQTIPQEETKLNLVLLLD